MTESASVTPRTEAGRRLVSGPNMRRQFLSDVLAIEREAAAPAATEALRAAALRVVQEWNGYRDDPRSLTPVSVAIEALRAALASPEPTPATADIQPPTGYHFTESSDRVAVKDATPATGLSAEALTGEALYRLYWSVAWDAKMTPARQWEQLDPTARAIWQGLAARLTPSTDSSEEGA